MLYLKQNALCVQLVLLKIIDLVSWGKTLLRGCEKDDVCWCDFTRAFHLRQFAGEFSFAAC